MATSLSQSEYDDKEELVNCPICYEPFEQPKVLPCLHTFCKRCLVGILQASGYMAVEGHMTCPTCRESVPLPHDGIDGFRDDFKVRKINEMFEKLALNQEMISQHIRCDLCKVSNRLSVPLPASSYCQKCRKFFCEDCKQNHEKSPLLKDHVMEPLKELSDETACQEHPGENVEYFCKTCEVSICAICLMTSHQNDKTTDIKTALPDLKGQLYQDLHLARDEVNQSLNDADETLTRMEAAFKKASTQILQKAENDILAIRQEEKRLTESLKKQHEEKMSVIRKKKESLQSKLTTIESLEESANDICGDGHQSEHGSQHAQIQACKEVQSRVQDTLPNDTDKVDSNAFLLRFYSKPNKPSLGEIQDTKNFKHLDLSLTLLKNLSTDEVKFNKPQDVCIMQDGKIIIADTENWRLLVFDTKGNFEKTIAENTIKPWGVSANNADTIVVTDGLSRGVKMFDQNGCMLREITSEDQTSSSLFICPMGIAAKGNKYVVSDIAKHNVTIIKFVYGDQYTVESFGSFGDGYDQFNMPCYIAMDENGCIVISDLGNHCIKLYQGSYCIGIIEQSQPGTGPSTRLSCPSGVCVDFLGYIFIADAAHNTVAIYSPDGEFVENLLTSSDGINYPQGVAINDQGMLVVTMCAPGKQEIGEVRVYTNLYGNPNHDNSEEITTECNQIVERKTQSVQKTQSDNQNAKDKANTKVNAC